MARRRKNEHHVRLYKHELQSEAWRSLSLVSKVLLVEMRALYTGSTNQVYISRREIEKRLGVGRKAAERAIKELLDRGFIVLLERGSFSRKDRHASIYALTHVPLDNERTARKDYMRWQPSVGIREEHSMKDAPQGYKNTWPQRDHDGDRQGPRTTPKSANNSPRVVPAGLRESPPQEHDGVHQDPTDRLPPGEWGRDQYRGTMGVCSCGNPTGRDSAKRNGRKLTWVACGACGRCDGFRLSVDNSIVASGCAAQRAFLAGDDA